MCVCVCVCVLCVCVHVHNKNSLTSTTFITYVHDCQYMYIHIPRTYTMQLRGKRAVINFLDSEGQVTVTSATLQWQLNLSPATDS